MNTIKAIETRYKGYRMRSRLEARWAVFFDALGVKWEYEPEGFDMTDLAINTVEVYRQGKAKEYGDRNDHEDYIASMWTDYGINLLEDGIRRKALWYD